MVSFCAILRSKNVFKFSKIFQFFRYDASEVEAPPPLQYDSSIDERDLTVDEWRKALWEEVTNWTPHPGYNNRSQPQMETE